MRSRRVIRGLVIVALALGLSGSSLADSVFLKLGDIKGESTAVGHEGEIEILSWSWGASNPATIGTTSGGLSAGRVAIADLSLMKLLDSATPKLFELVTRGTHTPKAVLIVRKEGDRPFDYLRITLEDVLVSSLQVSGATERPSESVSLSFAKVLVEYRSQSSSGSGSTWIPASWDLTKVAP
jgi:type VI secretion system secreted protein Hcp